MENINIGIEEVVNKLREKLSLEEYNNILLNITIEKYKEVVEEQTKEIEKQKKIIENYENQMKPKK